MERSHVYEQDLYEQNVYDQKQVQVLADAVRADVEQGLYFGAAIKVAHRGELIADLAIGHADAEATREISTDSVFSIFSLTKAFINVLVLAAVEAGRVALTTRVVDVIPEFAGAPRDRSTVTHLLTHTTGMPGVWEARPGMFLDHLEEAVEAVCSRVHGAVEPGVRCDYAPMANHVLLAELLRRTDPGGRSIGDILDQDLFAPLTMVDTALGVRAHVRERHVVPEMRGKVPVDSRSRYLDAPNSIYLVERNECTWAGGASTTADLLRFTDALRPATTGPRLLSRRVGELARTNWTGDLPNEIYRAVALRAGYEPPPAYIGLGFSLRGEKVVHHQFGTLTSPRTFGNYGAGSSVWWVDPELDLTFVALTAGLLSQAANIDRFQRLSDIVVAGVR
jgi:CubicO group peptidase (beta-lactamase class C family)